jgi:hypothetical protein
MEFLIGADPEVFVGDMSGVRSIIGKIGGTKDNPLPLPIGEGFMVQEDNVALEFNIPVSRSKAEFVKNISAATKFLESAVADAFGFKFVKQSAVSFPQEELNDPRAYVFGCEPDYNAWTCDVNPRPQASDPNLRSCGGHVHVGVNDFDAIAGVRACDLFLGVPAMILDADENASKRRALYGKAGAFRKKSYGFEYRTLSNFWIFEERFVEWVHDNTGRALDAVKAGMDIDSEKDTILEAINNNNKDAALYLIKKYSLELV